MTTPPLSPAARRIRKFLDEYRMIRNLDPEVIHALHGSDEDREASLLVSDLEELLKL